MKLRAILLLGLFLTALTFSITTSAKAKSAREDYHFPAWRFHTLHNRLFTPTASRSVRH